MDDVCITDGFYQGLAGRVIEREVHYGYRNISVWYQVKLNLDGKVVEVYRHDLKLIDYDTLRCI